MARQNFAPLRIAIVVALLMFSAGTSGAQSLEEQMRRPPGTNSLHDDSERLQGDGTDNAGTDSLDNDSMQLRGRTADQDGTNSLDNGSMDDDDR